MPASALEATAAVKKATDAKEALQLHNEVQSLITQLAEAEERWLRLQEELESN